MNRTAPTPLRRKSPVRIQVGGLVPTRPIQAARHKCWSTEAVLCYKLPEV